jgi:Protein of unknown function (DUF2845)
LKVRHDQKTNFTLVLALILIPPIFALPLTVTIFQQSAKLADEVATWNKQCGDKPSYDDVCMKKRYKISGELGQFVALVNDELEFLRGPVSADASDDFVQESNGRRKIMELEVRNALCIIKCLGVPASEPQCSAELAAIDEEKNALQAEYKETHAAFDGKWISLRASVSPASSIASGKNDPFKNCPLKNGDTLSKVKEFYHVNYDPQESGPRVPGGTYYAYHFPKYGVYVFFDNFLQVQTLRFDQPFSGKIGGVSVGDPKEQVVKLKGEPVSKSRSLDFEVLERAQKGQRISENNEEWTYKQNEREFVVYNFGSSSGKVQTIFSSHGN